MGQRANLLIVRNQSYELYYSHWCAYTLPVSLFWGEQYAIRFIELQKRVDEAGWLDDNWAEGGAVLDVEHRVLLFFGGEDILYDVPLRNGLLRLMKNNWPGWEIRWAHEGIADLAAYVGYPIDKVLAVHETSRQGACLVPPEEKKWVDLVASVAFSEQELLIFPLEGELEVFLTGGPRLLDGIDKSYGLSSLDLMEWTSRFPVGGFHIDVEGKKLQVWHAEPRPELTLRLQAVWPGWEIINQRSSYESQINCTYGRLQFQKLSQPELLAQLKTMLLGEPTSPVDTLVHFAEEEAAAGKKVEMNPDALRDDRYEMPKQVKKELLNKAIMNMNKNLFHSLEGTRLQLRTITMEDAAEMFAYLSDEEVSRFIGWRLMHTMEDTRRHIGTLLAREEAGTHLYAAVVLKATGAVIGNAMLFNMDDEAGHAEIGYVFHKGYWGQGYGTECVALVDNFAFGTLQLGKLYASVNEANAPSARILEKNGYMLDGFLSDGSLRYQKENGFTV